MATVATMAEALHEVTATMTSLAAMSIVVAIALIVIIRDEAGNSSIAAILGLFNDDLGDFTRVFLAAVAWLAVANKNVATRDAITMSPKSGLKLSC